MRILFDECVPKSLKREFVDLDITAVSEMGWSETKNGALLQLMSVENFDILLTSYQNIKYVQNLQKADVAVIVMVAYTNRVSDLLPLVPKVREILTAIIAGEIIEVTGN